MNVNKLPFNNKLKLIVLALTFIVSAAAGLAVMNNTNTSAASITAVINPWWPTDGVSLSGPQSLKAVVANVDVNKYDMFWTVDDGATTVMPSNYTISPHKEAVVDVSSWNWQTSSIYKLSFIAKAKNGDEIGRTTMNVTVYHPATTTLTSTVVAPTTTVSTTAPTVAPTSTVTTAPTTLSTTAPTTTSINFYVDQTSAAKQAADALRSSNPTNAALLDKIATRSFAKWFGGWNTNVQSDVNNYVSAAAGATPLLVAYNIPQRDCGGYSAGGTTPDAYLSWVRSVAAGIGSRSAWVILEPDAVAGLDCLTSTDQTTRLSLLSQAVSILTANTATRVYLDGGNPHWQTPAVMAGRLKAANIAAADGFSTNVSNFFTNADNTSYGQTLSSLIGNKHFVIDTSRSGLGPTADNTWCNPTGRALGSAPTSSTGNALVDAFLWVKVPGESDGTCNGGPSAGAWWTDYALGLAQRAAF